MEWLFINRLTMCIAVFIISLMTLGKIHNVAIDLVYTDISANSGIIGISDSDKAIAQKEVERDNVFLDRFKGKKVTKQQLRIAIANSPEYKNLTDKEIDEITDRISKKLKISGKGIL